MTSTRPTSPAGGEPPDTTAMFDALLLKYYRDELTDTERNWIRGYIATNSAARQEISLIDSMSDALQACTPVAHSRVGMDSVMQRVASYARSSSSPFSRLADWFGGTVSTKAFAGACALIALQFGLFGAFMRKASDAETDATQFRATQVAAVTHIAVRVSFKANTTERDMRFLLVSNGARIVAGPTQLGSYFLTVRKGGEQALAQALNASPLIGSVQVDVQLPDD